MQTVSCSHAKLSASCLSIKWALLLLLSLVVVVGGGGVLVCCLLLSIDVSCFVEQMQMHVPTHTWLKTGNTNTTSINNNHNTASTTTTQTQTRVFSVLWHDGVTFFFGVCVRLPVFLLTRSSLFCLVVFCVSVCLFVSLFLCSLACFFVCLLVLTLLFVLNLLFLLFIFSQLARPLLWNCIITVVVLSTFGHCSCCRRRC